VFIIYIEDNPDEVIVSQLDCVLARCPKVDGDIAGFLREVLSALGNRVEVHNG
jgi:hypothetical protein